MLQSKICDYFETSCYCHNKNGMSDKKSFQTKIIDFVDKKNQLLARESAGDDGGRRILKYH